MLDKLADVFEADRRLVQLHSMMPPQSVHQIRRGHRLSHAVLPAARLHQVVEQQSDDVIGRDKRSILVQNAKAVGVAVGGDADVRFVGLHRLAQIPQQMIIRLWRVAAKKHIAGIVHGEDFDSRRAQQFV